MAMHIEPGVVDGAKLAIGYATAVGFMGLTFRYLIKDILKGHANRLLVETIVTAFITLLSFEVFPHPTVGVSEVHIILGSTLLLLFGLVPAALGMASGLLLQGMLFALSDLPQFGMNVTTLLASLFATALRIALRHARTMHKAVYLIAQSSREASSRRRPVYCLATSPAP
jgi:ABC-type Co2+ transport system permease subunit